MGKVLDLNANLLPVKWLRSWPVVWRAFICFSLFVCLSNCGLATFHREFKIVGTTSFFECKSVRLKKSESPKNSSYPKNLFEAVFRKVLCTKA